MHIYQYGILVVLNHNNNIPPVHNNALQLMNSFSNGSQNTNLYFNGTLNEETSNNNELTLRFLPLDSLPTKNQTNTKPLSFKVLSCGTFETNHQSMVCSVHFVSQLYKNNIIISRTECRILIFIPITDIITTQQRV